jgi:hypothetical protein
MHLAGEGRKRASLQRAIVCVGSPGFSLHVRQAVQTFGSVRSCDSERAVLAALRDECASVLLIELESIAVAPVSSFVRLVKTEWDALYIVGYCRLSPTSSEAIIDAARGGLDAVIIHGFDDVRQCILRGIQRQADRARSTELLDGLRALLHPAALEVAEPSAVHLAPLSVASRRRGYPPHTCLSPGYDGFGSPTP